MNQPFGWEMEKFGVKTRPLEQTVLPVEADLLLGPDSSSEMDSETDEQPIPPPRCMLKLGMVILLISCRWCLALHSLDIIYTIFNTMFLVQTSYRMPSV